MQNHRKRLMPTEQTRENFKADCQAGKDNPRRKMLLSDVLNWRSTNHTDGSERPTGEPGTGNLEVANKQLIANLAQIFKGVGKAGEIKRKVDYKIGKSLEIPKVRKTSVTTEQSVKDSSRELHKPRRDGSLQEANVNKDLRHPYGRDNHKKLHRPPIPRAPKLHRKYDQVFLSKGEVNGHSVNVKVNVQIIADIPEKKDLSLGIIARPKNNPPKPPQASCQGYISNHNLKIQTRLVKQNTANQRSAVFPEIPCKSSFISNQCSDKSQLETSNLMDDSRKYLQNQRKADFVVRKQHTKTSTVDLSKDRLRKRVQLDKPLVRQIRQLPATNNCQESLDDLLILHQDFESDRRGKGQRVERDASSYSKRSTPNLMLRDQAIEMFAHDQICLFRRRNSDTCLSTNTKNKIDYFLSDNVTRACFEKIYKDREAAADTSALFVN